MKYLSERLSERSTKMVSIALVVYLVNQGVSTEMLGEYMKSFEEWLNLLSNGINILVVAGLIALPDNKTT